jgi:hypothetical protein
MMDDKLFWITAPHTTPEIDRFAHPPTHCACPSVYITLYYLPPSTYVPTYLRCPMCPSNPVQSASLFWKVSPGGMAQGQGQRQSQRGCRLEGKEKRTKPRAREVYLRIRHGWLRRSISSGLVLGACCVCFECVRACVLHPGFSCTSCASYSRLLSCVTYHTYMGNQPS